MCQFWSMLQLFLQLVSGIYYIKHRWSFLCKHKSSLIFSLGAFDLTLKVTLIFLYPFLAFSEIPGPWISRSPVSVDFTSCNRTPWAAAWWISIVVRQPFKAAPNFSTELLSKLKWYDGTVEPYCYSTSHTSKEDQRQQLELQTQVQIKVKKILWNIVAR